MSNVKAIKDAARQLDLPGRNLCIHSSMRSFYPRLDPREIIDTLLSLECTILIPSFSYDFEMPPPGGVSPERNGMDEFVWEYDKREFSPDENVISVRDMGALPEAVLSYPERKRGHHPIDSFSALGPNASQLVDQQSPDDVYAPLRQLTESDGRLLMIGTDLTSLTFIHYAEFTAGRALFVRWARKGKEVISCRVGGCSEGFNQLEPAVRGIAQQATVLGSNWRSLSATKALAALSETILEDPRITHCGRECVRCDDAVAGGPII